MVHITVHLIKRYNIWQIHDTENMIFHNLHMSKYVQLKKHVQEINQDIRQLIEF